jgi:hypothetical protein
MNGYDGLEVRRTWRSKRKRAAKPQATAFLLVQTSDSTKDTNEIKLPEAGDRLEAIGEREQPLTTHHLPHMSPSGLKPNSQAAITAKQPYARSAPSSPPAPCSPGQSPGGQGGPSGWVGADVRCEA